MSRSLQDFIVKFKAISWRILNSSQTIINDNDRLIYLSGEFNLADLNYIVKKIEKSNNNQDIATKENLQDVITFLDLMWQSAMNTKKILHLNPQAHINIICVALVKLIAEIVVQIDIKNRADKINETIYQYLIPTLKRHDFKRIEQIHYYIMSDNNETMIDVYECLYNYEKSKANDGRLRHTHPTANNQDYLSDDEVQRIISYSQETKIYYEALMASKPDKNINAKRIAAQHSVQNPKTIIGNEYGHQYTPGVSFEELSIDRDRVGWQKLKFQMYGRMTTLPELVKRLYKLPVNAWEKYTDNIVLDFPGDVKISEQYRLLIKDKEKKISPAITKTKFSQNNEKENRAILFSFFYYYYRERKLEPAYTGMFWGYSREEKCSAAMLIVRFLTSKRPLATFDEYLDSDECKIHLGPLGWDDLGGMVKKMKEVCSLHMKFEAREAMERSEPKPK